jgi:hypothetical protein
VGGQRERLRALVENAERICGIVLEDNINSAAVLVKIEMDNAGADGN